MSNFGGEGEGDWSMSFSSWAYYKLTQHKRHKKQLQAFQESTVNQHSAGKKKKKNKAVLCKECFGMILEDMHPS